MKRLYTAKDLGSLARTLAAAHDNDESLFRLYCRALAEVSRLNTQAYNAEAAGAGREAPHTMREIEAAAPQVPGNHLWAIAEVMTLDDNITSPKAAGPGAVTEVPLLLLLKGAVSLAMKFLRNGEKEAKSEPRNLGPTNWTPF